MNKELRQKSLGVSFSGGGVQAWAEVAAYAELERQGIEIDAVAGTSMGSFIAAAIASGLTSEEVYQIIQDTDHAIVESSIFGRQAFFSLFSFRQPMGLVLMEKLAEVIRPVSKIYGEVMLSDVPKPLAIPAVDIIQNKMIIFSNQPEYFKQVYENAEFYDGDISLVKACLASSAYPVILSPVEVEDYQLIDGGVLMNSPAALFSKVKIEYILELRLPQFKNVEPAGKRMDVALRAIGIMVANQENKFKEISDQQYYLDVNVPGIFEFGDSEPIIEAGKKFVSENPIDVTDMYEEIEREPEQEGVSDVKIILEEPSSFSERLADYWDKLKTKFN